MSERADSYRKTTEFYREILGPEDINYLQTTTDNLLELKKWIHANLLPKMNEDKALWKTYPFHSPIPPPNVLITLDESGKADVVSAKIDLFDSIPEIVKANYRDNPLQFMIDVNDTRADLENILHHIKRQIPSASNLQTELPFMEDTAPVDDSENLPKIKKSMTKKLI